MLGLTTDESSDYFRSFPPRKQHDNREPVDAPLFLGRELLPVPRTPDLHLLRRLRNGVAISSVIPTNYTPIPIKYEQRASARRSLSYVAEGFGSLFFFLLLVTFASGWNTRRVFDR